MRKIGLNLCLSIALAWVGICPPSARAQADTWILSGKITAKVRARGRVGKDTVRTEGVILELDQTNLTYRQPGTFLCGGETFFLAETGAATPLGKKGKKFRLEPSNLEELLLEAEECLLGISGVSLIVKKYFHKAVLKRGGARLKLKTKFTGRLAVVDAGTFPFKVIGRFSGEQGNGVVVTTPPVGRVIGRIVERATASGTSVQENEAEP